MSLVKTVLSFSLGYYLGINYSPVINNLLKQVTQQNKSIIVIDDTTIKFMDTTIITFKKHDN